MRAGVGRIERHRPFEQQHCAIERFVRLRLPIDQSAGERFVCLDDVGLLLSACRRDGRTQRRRQLAHQPVLQIEDGEKAAIHLGGAGELSGRDIGNRRGHPDAVAQALEPAAHNPACAQLASRAQQQVLVALAGLLAEPLEHGRDAIARDDRDAFELARVGGQRFRDARAQPVVFRVARDVRKRGDGNARRIVRRIEQLRQLPPEPDRGNRVVHVAGAGDAPIGIALEHPADQALDIGQPRVAIGAGQRRHVLLLNRLQQLRGARARERRRAAGEFVHHDAQREDVGASVDLAADRLLRRHVRQRADEAGERADRSRHARHIVGSGDRRRAALRHAEVEHFHPASRRHHDVRRFDVAMHEPEAMRLAQRIGDLFRDVERLIDVHDAAPDQSRQGGAFDVLHRDVRHQLPVVLGFAGFVDNRDVGVIQRRGGARLVEQAADAAGRRRIRAQRLQGDDAAKQEILRAIHLAHAARAEAIKNPVVGERGPNHRLFKGASFVIPMSGRSPAAPCHRSGQE